MLVSKVAHLNTLATSPNKKISPYAANSGPRARFSIGLDAQSGSTNIPSHIIKKVPASSPSASALPAISRKKIKKEKKPTLSVSSRRIFAPLNNSSMCKPLNAGSQARITSVTKAPLNSVSSQVSPKKPQPQVIVPVRATHVLHKPTNSQKTSALKPSARITDLSRAILAQCYDHDVALLCKIASVSKQFKAAAEHTLSVAIVLRFPPGKLSLKMEDKWIDRCKNLKGLIISPMNNLDLNAIVALRTRLNRHIPVCELPAFSIANEALIAFDECFAMGRDSAEDWEYHPEFDGLRVHLQNFLEQLEDDLGQFLPRERNLKLEKRALYTSIYRKIIIPYFESLKKFDNGKNRCRELSKLSIHLEKLNNSLEKYWPGISHVNDGQLHFKFDHLLFEHLKEITVKFHKII